MAAVTGLEDLPSGLNLNPAMLGMDPADLLQHARVFLVVEGLHDEVVVRALLGEELDDCGVVVVPMRGVTKLPEIIDSQFLFDYTTARLVVLVDSGEDRDPADAWDVAVMAASTGDLDEARQILLERLDRKVAEESLIQEFGRKALDAGREDRVQIVAISPPDLLDLLPVRAIVPDAPTDDRERLRKHDQAPMSGSNFKRWLGGFGFDPEDTDRVKMAALSLESIPADSLVLRDILVAASRSPWALSPPE
jgi:hypothetical protein